MQHFVTLVLSIFLLVLPVAAFAKNKQATYSIGAFNEPQGDRGGLEIAIMGKGDYFGGKVGGVLYTTGSRTNENNQLYAGFSGFGFIHGNLPINPYLGLGVFVGKTSSCTAADEEYNSCSEDAELALYPEVGVEININKVQVTPYIRRYFDTNTSWRSGNVYGINFGLRF